MVVSSGRAVSEAESSRTAVVISVSGDWGPAAQAASAKSIEAARMMQISLFVIDLYGAGGPGRIPSACRRASSCSLHVTASSGKAERPGPGKASAAPVQ